MSYVDALLQDSSKLWHALCWHLRSTSRQAREDGAIMAWSTPCCIRVLLWTLHWICLIMYCKKSDMHRSKKSLGLPLRQMGFSYALMQDLLVSTGACLTFFQYLVGRIYFGLHDYWYTCAIAILGLAGVMHGTKQSCRWNSRCTPAIVLND